MTKSGGVTGVPRCCAASSRTTLATSRLMIGVIVFSFGGGTVALADEDGPQIGVALTPSADSGELLPLSLSGTVGAEAAVVRAYGEHDRRQGRSFSATAEVWLGARSPSAAAS